MNTNLRLLMIVSDVTSMLLPDPAGKVVLPPMSGNQP
jgi:hypothetical protein